MHWKCPALDVHRTGPAYIMQIGILRKLPETQASCLFFPNYTNLIGGLDWWFGDLNSCFS